MIVRYWKKLNPKLQRLTVIAAAVGAISVVVVLLPSGKDTNERKSNQEVIRHVLTDRDTRTVGLDSLAAAVKDMQGKSTDQTRLMKKLERDLELSMKQRNTVPPIVSSQLERLTGQVTSLETMLKETQEKLKAGGKGVAEGGAVAGEDGATGAAPEGGDAGATSEGGAYSSQLGQGGGASPMSDLMSKNPLEIFQNNKWPTSITGDATGPKGKAGGNAAAPKIRVIMEKEEPVKKPDAKALDESFYLPAGSIINGVLLNGMDAPTGQGARKDLFPATMRIQKEAVLPNRFRADIRECFVIVSGYGDLSSERAYLRGETISCVREDGAVMEASLDSYAVGEDGKAGVRGRLVSKQGQVIARSLMAGFLSGLSQAFDVKPVPFIDTSNSSGRGGNTTNTQFQKNQPNGDWLQSSAASGASAALERVADFYIKMAEGMFPVIEVDAGRQVDLIINKGTKMQFRSMGTQK